MDGRSSGAPLRFIHCQGRVTGSHAGSRTTCFDSRLPVEEGLVAQHPVPGAAELVVGGPVGVDGARLVVAVEAGHVRGVLPLRHAVRRAGYVHGELLERLPGPRKARDAGRVVLTARKVLGAPPASKVVEGLGEADAVLVGSREVAGGALDGVAHCVEGGVARVHLDGLPVAQWSDEGAASLISHGVPPPPLLSPFLFLHSNTRRLTRQSRPCGRRLAGRTSSSGRRPRRRCHLPGRCRRDRRCARNRGCSFVAYRSGSGGSSSSSRRWPRRGRCWSGMPRGFPGPAWRWRRPERPSRSRRCRPRANRER
ncbi:hypothetical protein CTA1_12201 [Colletotrichum tanaceti]|uniref:Uncharacterized protein n=1 Tax=Colletotrichum tanaceti TaxID=1306861 RepID=A0A4V6DH73_9PEZI|nr:hypothetical protein CTA1_12201 [Colletotrichum tanaceti]